MNQDNTQSNKLAEAKKLLTQFYSKDHSKEIWNFMKACEIFYYEKGREDERSKICGELVEKGDHDQGDFFIRQDLFDKIFNQY